MDKCVNQMDWHERYEASKQVALDNAMKGRTIETFICLVDKKYKLSIWNWAVKEVSRRKIQKELDFGQTE